MFAFTCRREFPGGSVVRPQRFQYGSPGSILGWRTRIPEAIGMAKLKTKQNKTKQFGYVCDSHFLKALLQMEVPRG